jgi:hypothetical protein
MHACSRCGTLFEPARNRTNDLSWKSIFTRPIKAFSLGEDIESFDLVKCPTCGHIEGSSQLKIFGAIPGSRVKLVLAALLICILAFGWWLVRMTSR